MNLFMTLICGENSANLLQTPKAATTDHFLIE